MIGMEGFKTKSGTRKEASPKSAADLTAEPEMSLEVEMSVDVCQAGQLFHLRPLLPPFQRGLEHREKGKISWRGTTFHSVLSMLEIYKDADDCL